MGLNRLFSIEKRYLLIGTLALIGLLALSLKALLHCHRSQKTMTRSLGEFTFIDGKPYVEASIEGQRVLSLFDTGSTFNILPSKLVKALHQVDSRKRSVRTVLGSRDFRTTDAVVSLDGHISPGTRHLIGDLRRPVIGAGLIFSTRSIYISKEGFQFDPSFDMKDASHCDNGIVLDLSGQALDAPIGRIYLTLLINGTRELVMLDTGNANFLTGTRRDNDNQWQFPDGLQVISDANGSFGIRRYINRTAMLSIGDSNLPIKYKSYPGYVEPRVRYVLGAEFLNHYSLYMEPRRGKICYFARTKS